MKKQQTQLTTRKKGTGLKWVRINDVNLIPRYLIEQIDPLTFDIDHFYRVGNVFAGQPLHIFGVFVTQDAFQVKGFMWVTINPLTLAMHGNLLSVDKDYQGRGFVHESHGIVKGYMKKYGLKKLSLSTKTPEKFKSNGAQKSELVLMDVSEGV